MHDSCEAGQALSTGGPCPPASATRLCRASSRRSWQLTRTKSAGICIEQCRPGGEGWEIGRADVVIFVLRETIGALRSDWRFGRSLCRSCSEEHTNRQTNLKSHDVRVILALGTYENSIAFVLAWSYLAAGSRALVNHHTFDFRQENLNAVSESFYLFQCVIVCYGKSISTDDCALRGTVALNSSI